MKRTALLLALLAGTFAPASFASPDEGDGARGREARAGRAEGRPALARARRHRRRAHARRLLASLSPEQRAALREARGAALAIRKETVDGLRSARREARADGLTDDERAALRAKGKEARAQAIERTLPHARKVLDSLDSEQRARLLRFAERRGLEATDDAVAHRLAKRLLLRPRGPAARRLWPAGR